MVFIFKQQCTIYKYKGQDLFNALSAQWDAFVLNNSKNCVGKHMKELKAICTKNKAMDDYEHVAHESSASRNTLVFLRGLIVV